MLADEIAEAGGLPASKLVDCEVFLCARVPFLPDLVEAAGLVEPNHRTRMPGSTGRDSQIACLSGE